MRVGEVPARRKFTICAKWGGLMWVWSAARSMDVVLDIMEEEFGKLVSAMYDRRGWEDGIGEGFLEPFRMSR